MQPKLLYVHDGAHNFFRFDMMLHQFPICLHIQYGIEEEMNDVKRCVGLMYGEKCYSSIYCCEKWDLRLTALNMASGQHVLTRCWQHIGDVTNIEEFSYYFGAINARIHAVDLKSSTSFVLQILLLYSKENSSLISSQFQRGLLLPTTRRKSAMTKAGSIGPKNFELSQTDHCSQTLKLSSKNTPLSL
ncbi:hypothetical protein MTR67_001906 [Solanum verrucosum]|uniref:Uncharacterized protein n=1 Tax=Solanum verrucosum TaxID=315347 RepID=A0AAF0PQ10_SOLVR|nr:hypothetical protein MTR67_001906 [Solanum verrucosum]